MTLRRAALRAGDVRVRRRWAATLVLALVVLLAIGLGDQIVGLTPADLAPPARPIAATPAGARPAGRSRVFALLVDSLRYETAVDPAIMPRLGRMFPRGVVARVTTTRNAVTGPAVRAAFTGVDRTAIFGFVTSFVKGGGHVPSLFTDLHAEGRTAVAYSEGFFQPFGEDVIERPNRDEGVAENEARSQNEHARAAVAAFRGGTDAFVLAHIVYGDFVAHEVGVRGAKYRARHAEIDALIEEIDRTVPPEDTFVVFGDHGHDETGRHALGLDVPTFAFYRGPGFRPGVDLGTMHITDHRYLLGWALGLPLPASYARGRHPEALAAPGPLPPDYAAPSVDPGPPPAWFTALRWACALAFAGVLGAILIVLDHALGPLPRPPLPRRRLAIAAIAAALMVVWGALLGRFAPHGRDPSDGTLLAAWLALGAATLAVGLRHPRLVPPILAAPLFLLPATVHGHGAPAAMAPVWMLGALALAAAARTRAASIAAVGAVIALWPFKAVHAAHFHFVGWLSWPVGLLPGGWWSLDAIALIVLFVRRQRPVAVAAALLMAGLVFQLHQHEIELGREEIFLAGAFALLAFALRLVLWRRLVAGGVQADVPLIAAIERTLFLGALLIGFHATVSTLNSTFVGATVLLAAAALTAPLLGRVPAWAARAGFAILGVLAALAAGWVGLAWTVHRLEWYFLYDYDRFSAAAVEQHVGWFVPAILLRYALPAIAARRLIAEGAPDVARAASWDLVRLVGVKAASLALLLVGLGLVEGKSDGYLEAAQEAGIWLVVAGGIV